MASKKLEEAYRAALRDAARSARAYDPDLRRHTRVPEKARHSVVQRARWSTQKHPKNGRYVYIRYQGHQEPMRIYQLSKADVRKWEKAGFDPLLLGHRIGEIVFEKFRGAWHHYPPDFRAETTSVEISSAAGDIVRHLSIDYDKAGGKWGIKDAIEGTRTAFERRKSPRGMAHYNALLAESKKTGWPTRFKRDLTEHDKRELMYRDPSLPFGWVLRESGTHLIFPENDWDGKPPGYAARSIASSFGGEGLKWYVWDGISLQKKNQKTWAEWMDREHRKAAA